MLFFTKADVQTQNLNFLTMIFGQPMSFFNLFLAIGFGGIIHFFPFTNIFLVFSHKLFRFCQIYLELPFSVSKPEFFLSKNLFSPLVATQCRSLAVKYY